MPDIHGNDHAASHPDGEAGDIDEAVKLSFHQLAPGDLEEVTEH